MRGMYRPPRSSMDPCLMCLEELHVYDRGNLARRVGFDRARRVIPPDPRPMPVCKDCTDLVRSLEPEPAELSCEQKAQGAQLINNFNNNVVSRPRHCPAAPARKQTRRTLLGKTMHNSRRGLLSSTVLATLLLASPGTLPLAQAPAPLRPQPFRPAAGPLAPAGWAFANIRVSVLGPNTVRIDWAPLSGADLYRIYRNGAQVGPDYPAALAPSQSFSALDNAAPGAATLSYQVIAFHMTTIYGAPGTPGAGAHAGEGPLQASVSVAVTTPAPAPVL